MTYLTNDSTHGVVVAAADVRPTIAISPAESPAVARAVAHLAADIHAVTGLDPAVQGHTVGARVVVGTWGTSELVDALIARGLDISGLLGPDGGRRWEAFTVQTVGDVVAIVGADRRGTLYGVYDLSERIGVSPWYWFADVPVHRRPEIVVALGTSYTDYPSVRYRGIFVNDEEELFAWARAHTGDDTIGPQAYERIFELVLRLKGNHVWPAMHVDAFNRDPRNGRLADEMGIVIGTSHCDMLLRSNQNEWAPWLAQNGGDVHYDYSIPGENRDKLMEYWRGSVRQNGGYEVGWTLGVRGIHDTGFETSAIDSDEHLSEQQKHRARVDLLGQAIEDQIGLLDAELGSTDDRLTTFVPYKEVLPLYDDGLRLPDDVTIVWADDNFGYVRRYPSAQELERSGGHGLYYHSSYWSQPPRSYLFISSQPLAQMHNELTKAWDHGIRALWVNNVGAIKPLEQDFEYFLRYAWEVGKSTRATSTDDVTAFTARWVDRNFSGGHGAQVARIYNAFAQITNARKIEHLAANAFSQTAYGDEAARRLARLRELHDEVTQIQRGLPAHEQDSFFQLVAMKVHASYLSNAQFVHADRSTLAHRQGKLPAADRHLTISREYDEQKRAMIHHYNHVMSGGKWSGILTPEDFPPPTTALFPPGRPALKVDAARLGVVTWGSELPASEPRLEFSAFGVQRKWIEVFSTGFGGVDYTITTDDWIGVSSTAGHVDIEERIDVWVNDPAAHAGSTGHVTVHSPTDGSTITVQVAVAPDLQVAAGARVEDDGVISVPADDPDLQIPSTTSRWVQVDHLARDHGALLQVVRDTAVVDDEPVTAGGRLGYRVHLATAGAHELELHRFPTLNSTGRVRLAIGVDDLAPVVVESATTDEKRGNWWEMVLTNVEKLRLRLPYLDAGEHTVWVYAIDEHVAFSAFVIYTGDRRETALPPRASVRAGEPLDLAGDPSPLPTEWAALEAVRKEVYRVGYDDVEPHRVVYAPAAYWDGDTTFRRVESVPQLVLGRPYAWATDTNGPKDVLAGLTSGPVREHRAGAFAVDIQQALRGDAHGYVTSSLDASPITWTHTQAETGGRTGLALHVDARGRRWDDPALAPGVHVSLDIATTGTYRTWVLAKYDSREDDSAWVAIDGTVQPLAAQFCGGDLYSFGTQQVWTWVELCDLTLPAGVHTLSFLARKAGLRLARAYLTTTDERPPADADWPRSDTDN